MKLNIFPNNGSARTLILGSLFSLAVCSTISLTVSPAQAQPGSEKKSTQSEARNEILRNYALTKGFTYGRPQKPKFSQDGKAVLFLRAGATEKTQKLYHYDIETKQTTLLADPTVYSGGQAENLSPEEKARRERLRLYTAGFADYQVNPKNDNILLPLSGKLYLCERGTKAWRQLDIEGSTIDAKWSPDGKKVAYVKGFDVYCYDIERNKERRVTSGGTAEVPHGVAEFVAQEEMGRFSGFWWNPESTRIAFTEANHKDVDVWTISDPSRPDKPGQKQYYPRPGRQNVAVRLGIVSIAAEDSYPITWCTPPAKSEYLAAVHWDKEGALTAQWQDRGQKDLTLCLIDSFSGSSTVLCKESHPAWVNIQAELPVWLPGGKQFIFNRQVTGYDRLTLHDAQGKILRTVVPDADPVAQFHSLHPYGDNDARLTYSSDPGPGNSSAKTLAFNPKGQVLDATWAPVETGVQEVVACPSNDLRIVTQHTLKELPITKIVDNQGKELGRLPSVALEPDQKLNFEQFTVDNGNGTPLKVGVIKPKSFVAGKKYPVIVDVYGGPHKIQVTLARKNWIIDQWLADQGFIVVAVDNRGTPHRGVAFETAIYGKFDSVPLEDQVAGLKAIGQRVKEMDMSRVGIFGWSFGGYLSAQAILKRPDVYKAAVSGAPVTDWEDYDTHYTERYLGLLPESQAAYDSSALAPLASNLSRPLLLIHGTADDNVYFRNSLRLADALFKEGKYFEMLPLAGITHSYSSDPLVTERVLQRTIEFFRRNL